MSRLRRAALGARRAAGGRVEGLLTVAAAVVLVAMVATAVGPFFRGLDRWGVHDWDSGTFYRWLAVDALKHGQFPFWQPWGCGGYTAWGYVEGDTIVVSPWLPAYLGLSLRKAIAVEAAGNALLGALGTWLLAGRFTRSRAARLLVCAVFVVNGRWALQATVGHVWHALYAWMPWALYFYDRALGSSPFEPARGAWHPSWWRWAAASGFVLAMFVYGGGLYPLPHAILAIAIYGASLAIAGRTWQPIAAGAVAGATLAGFAAPKLLPTLDAFAKAPRLVDSNEWMDLGTFVTMLTGKAQGNAHPSQWGWHEWGMYVGWGPFLAVCAFALVASGRRENALKLAGVFFVACSFGKFHDWAPWPLLHELPIFRSQHVPSRFLHPGFLLLALAAASSMGRLFARLGRARPLADAFALALVSLACADIGEYAKSQTEGAFHLELPRDIKRSPDFHTEATVPPTLRYVNPDWSIPSMPAAMANVGVLECYTVAALSVFAKDARGLVPGLGAKARGQPDYRGEAYLASGEGLAVIRSFSANQIVVDVQGARAGDLLVLNQNFDPSWRANGTPASEYKQTIAAAVHGGNEQITFRYRPRRLAPGLAILGATVLALLAAGAVGRRRRAGRTVPPARP